MNEILEHAYREFRPRIIKYLQRKYYNVNYIEDLTNDGFMAANKYYHLFDPDKSTFKTWLTNICENKVKMEFVKNTIKTTSIDYKAEGTNINLHEVIPDVITYDPDIDFIINIKARIITDEIYKLEDPKFKEILILREIDGLHYQEIADYLDITLQTAKNRIRKARILVRNKVRVRFTKIDNT